MTSKRDIERRLEKVEEAFASHSESKKEPPAAWKTNIPNELWGENLDAWRYFITDEDSHPDLDPDTEE